jgi:hypothetical protein
LWNVAVSVGEKFAVWYILSNKTTTSGSWTMLNFDTWLRQQVWQLLSQGPGAVSAYWSIPVPLVCAALSLRGPTGLAGATLCILLINVLLGVLLILVDEIDSCRNHNLGLLRLSAAKSRDRIAKLGIRSKQVDRFVDALWLNPELTVAFRNTHLQSVELLVLGLDLLSRIACRYGRCGRKVFEANQHPMVRAMELFECMPLADAEKILVEPLTIWLKDSPEYDPEGWALSLLGQF